MSAGEAQAVMSGLRYAAVGSIGVAAALVFAGMPIWGAQVDVGVPEPTGDPAAENQYNVTVIGDVMGEPLNPGDTVSLGSSTEITSVTEGISSGGVQDASKDTIDAPFRNGQGNWSVDVKLGNDVRALVVTYKGGRKRVVVIATKAKNVAVDKYEVKDNGTIYVHLTFDSVGDGKKRTAAAGAQNWTKPASAPAAPGVKLDAGRDLDRGPGGGSGATTR